MRRYGPLLFLVCSACAVGILAQAQDGPTMEVTWTNYLGEYDDYHSGPERVFRYTIRNTSAPFATNDLFYLVLPVGLDAGLFYAWFDQSPLDWETWYAAADTLLANTNTPIGPGSTATLELRTDSLVTRFDYATALAVGQYSSGPHPAFTPVLVEVPAGPYPPQKLTSVSIATNTVTLTAEGLRWNYHYTLEQSAQMTDWTNVADFWVTWENTNRTQRLSLPFATNAHGQFFRLRSP